MVATIFQDEIGTLESQVAQLQVQIAAAQSRITALGEADVVASGAITALSNAVAKIHSLAPSAIATLKAAALNLFQGDDRQDDNNGNHPQPATPPPGSNGNGHKTEVVLGTDIVEISSKELEKYLENQASTVAPEVELNGQFSELACLLEDAPSIALTGQAVEIACPLPSTDSAKDKPYIELVQFSQILAYQQLHNGEIPAAYIAFKSKTRAEAWGRWLVAQNNIGDGFEVRAAKRMLGFKWEIKLWGISFDGIQRLAKLGFSGVPNVVALNALAKAPDAVVEETHPEHTISTSDAVIEVEPQAPYPTIDPSDVPQGVTLRSTDDDLLREYIVWASVIARNNGVPEPTQKQIGQLVQGSEIEAYRPRSGLCRTFTTTMDAVVYLVAGAGLKMADIFAAVEMRDASQQESPTTPVTPRQEPPIAPVTPGKTTVEVLSKAVDTQENSAALKVGSSVQIMSPRHGEQLVGQVGTVIASTPVGCVVVLGDLTRWFCTDEVVYKGVINAEAVPADNSPAIEVEAATDNSFTIEVGDWVELLENGQNYEVVGKRGSNLKLQSGDEIKFIPVSGIKFLFRVPGDFTPF